MGAWKNGRDWYQKKQCITCKKEKYLGQFSPTYEKDRDKDGLSVYCRQCNPEYKRRRKVLSITHRAIKQKEIIRPPSCEICGIHDKDYVPKLPRSPKTYICAHHEDYDKPLQVVWLCFKCHRMRHGSNKKDKNICIQKKVKEIYNEKYLMITVKD